MLFNKCNVDVNGKATIVDPDTGRQIYIGDGIIPQVERFASKYAFAKLTVNIFNTVLAMMVEKSDNPTGNKYLFIVIYNKSMHCFNTASMYKNVYQNIKQLCC